MRISIRRRSMLEAAKKEVKNNKILFLINFHCVPTKQLSVLRTKAVAENIKVGVFPISILKLVIISSDSLLTPDKIKGQLLIMCGDDILKLCEVLKSIGMNYFKLGIKNQRSLITLPEIQKVAELPSLIELKLGLINVLNLPFINLIVVLTGILNSRSTN